MIFKTIRKSNAWKKFRSRFDEISISQIMKSWSLALFLIFGFIFNRSLSSIKVVWRCSFFKGNLYFCMFFLYKGYLPSKVVFQQWFTSIRGVFNRKWSSTRLSLKCQIPVQEASTSEALFFSSNGCHALKVVFHQKLSSIEGWILYSIKGQLILKVFLLQHLSYFEGLLPLKVSYIKGRILSKVVFHLRSSSIKGCLQLNVVFHQRWSSIKWCLPSNVVFHQMLSSINSCLPLKAVFHQSSLRFWWDSFYCSRCCSSSCCWDRGEQNQLQVCTYPRSSTKI